MSIVGGYAAYTYLDCIAPGTATITATTATGKIATCVVTVRAAIQAEKNVEYTMEILAGNGEARGVLPYDLKLP